MDERIFKDIQSNIKEVKELSGQIRHYLLAPAGPTVLRTDKYSDLIDGIKVLDITSPEQQLIGMTLLQVLSTKEVDFNEHTHEGQNQLIYVKHGKILDKTSNILFEAGQGFYTGKGKIHSVRYFPDTDVLIVYLPKLGTF